MTAPFTHTITPEGDIGKEISKDVEKREERQLNETREKLVYQIINESTKFINKHPEKYNTDKTVVEAVPIEQIQNGEIFDTCVDTDLKDFSPAVRNAISRRAQNVVVRAIEKYQESSNEAQPLISRKALNKIVLEVFAQETEEPPEVEDTVEFTAKTISGFGNEESFVFKMSVIKSETNSQTESRIRIAEKIKSKDGTDRALKNTDGIVNDKWMVCEIIIEKERHINLYFPQNELPDNQDAFIYHIQELAGGYSDFSGLLPQETNEVDTPVVAYMLHKKNLPRSFEFYNNGDPYIFAENGKRFEFLHEAVHEKLDRMYGKQHIGILLEGPTTYCDGRLVQSERLKKNGDSLLPYNQRNLLKTMCAKIPVEQLSWSSDITGELVYDSKGKNAKEYIYPYARLFAEFFIEKYGKEKYYQLYGATASKQKMLVDAQTGKTLIHNGNVITGVTEYEILEAGMLTVGVEPEEVKKDLYEYIKSL